jgi:hypothetical protein
MRHILMLGLAAATLVPAVAQAQGGPDNHHEQRMDRHDDRHDERGGDWRNNDRHDRRDDRRDDRREYRQEARREAREDWREYRRAHAEAFRGPAYYGPRGYVYRPVAPGYRFGRDYYARRYWLDNPGAYRLPPAGPNDRYVRYGRDVIRVDIRNGRVLQVFGSFFL